MTNPLNRRQFIQLGGGAVVIAGLGACERQAVGRNAATNTTALPTETAAGPGPTAAPGSPSTGTFDDVCRTFRIWKTQ